MLNADLAVASERFVNWMVKDALPLWLDKGMKAGAGHYERLQASGRPDTAAPVRARVQARQAYAFAVAHGSGWANGAADAALNLYRFYESKARHPREEVGYIHLLNADFEPLNIKQDLYDHAFFLLALSALYRITDEPMYLIRANSIMAWLDRKFGSYVGGWLEGDYRASCRRQNPHMHLFEAFMSLYECSDDERWLARAGEVFSLFQGRFYDAKFNVVREFFNDDWAPLESDRGRIIEPGHMMEWVWLLRWYERLSKRSVSEWADALYIKANAIGFNKNGLMYDELDISGEAKIKTKRSWPMTEVIKANIAQARAGVEGAEERAAAAINILFSYYLDVPIAGSWIDQRGKNDEVLVNIAPASTFYHIIVACKEVADYCSSRYRQNLSENSFSRLMRVE